MNSWAWYPSTCSLESFNGLKLSRKLAGREVLAIGDSLGVQQFVALAQLMCPNQEQCAISTVLDPNRDWTHFYTLHSALFQMEVRSKKKKNHLPMLHTPASGKAHGGLSGLPEPHAVWCRGSSS